MVELTDFKSKHFSTLASWLSSERDVVQWGGPDLTYPLSTSQLDHMMNEGRTTPPACLCWMAVDASQAIIGHVQLALDWKNGVARLGRAMIAPGMRGQGHAPALIKAVVANAFSFETIKRTELNVYSWNTAAIRTYEKTGFSHEGTRRSSVKVGEERWDTIIMGMLRTEWQRTIKSRSSLR